MPEEGGTGAEGGSRDPGKRNGEGLVTKLRPTLFVALGGTGKEIALRLRRRILQNEWGSEGRSRRLRDIGEFPVAAFAYFDTDTTEAVQTDRAQRTDPLAAAVAFRDNERLQHGVDVLRYVRDLDSFPHIRSWLPEGDLSAINTEKGAGQVRAISRLLFFDQFARFQQLVRDGAASVLNNVGRQQQLKDLALDIEHELRVVVLASVAGGTGSGAFIDAGLMIRAMREPEAKQVDLVLLLPGGFRGAGLQRVNANGFAALMELEHAMRPGSTPPYAERWTSDGARPLRPTPFNDVYLIDTTNVSRDQTDDVGHMYDMVADVLFEDFGSSDFSARKRSVSVNANQYKLVNWMPPLPERFGPRALSFSCAFSSFGQATVATRSATALEAAAVLASRRMVQSFFNVALRDSGRLPTPEERRDFANDAFGLGTVSFLERLGGIADDAPIEEPALVGTLLTGEAGDTVPDRLAATILGRYEEEILASGDLRNWPALALRVWEESREDVVGRIDHQGDYGPSGLAVRANRQRLARHLRSEAAGGMRDRLFGFLDNRARGGLDYTIRLVEETKLSLDAEAKRLAAVRGRYEKRAALVTARFERSRANLADAVRNRLILGPDRKAADRFLGHLREETAYHAALRLRAVACTEAIAFLAEASRDLGTPRGPDAEGRPQWDGAVAELLRGREQVEAVLAQLDGEVALLHDAAGRRNAGTYIVLPDADAEAERTFALDAAEIAAWAEEVFKGEGGSRAIYPRLEDRAALAELLGKLRGYARAQLAPRAERLRSARETLLAMDAEARRRVLGDAMRRAMPWVNARFDRLGDSLPVVDRFKLFAAVDDAAAFGPALRAELREAIPASLGVHALEVVSSGLRDRLVIYCELSGIPLDTIVPLGEGWRRDYLAERRGPLPLHNHRSASRFANPVVPNTAEIEELRRTVSLFLRGAALGVLRRNEGAEAAWKLDFGFNDWQDVGTERDVRAEGMLPVHRDELAAAVRRAEDAWSPLQFLAASALLLWTGRHVYPARRVPTGPNSFTRPAGLVQLVATEAAAAYLARSRAAEGAGRIDRPEAVRDALLATVPAWTEAVPGSAADADPFDANQDPDDPPELRAADKRAIVPARFAALETVLRPGPVAQAPQAVLQAAPQAAATPASRWFLSVRKTLLGPFDLGQLAAMAARGELAEGTNVRPVEERDWTRVRHVPALRALLEAGSLPEDEDPGLPDDE